MKTKKSFSMRTLFAAALFSTAMAFAGLSLTGSGHPFGEKQTNGTLKTTSSPKNPLLFGNSYQSIWNDIFVSSMQWMRSFKARQAGEIVPKVARWAAAGAVANTSSVPQAPGSMLSDVVLPAVSAPVRNLPAANQFSMWVERPEEPPLQNRIRQQPISPSETDPVLQDAVTAGGMPAVATSFEGINVSQGCGNCFPPDPNGAVGPNHYVQTVNAAFAVYDKSGNVLTQPAAINMLWSSAGAPTSTTTCATHNNGDPIVIYDQLADRWIISQFTSSATYAECIAGSQTSDPTGAYNLYEFDLSNDTFNDYPHLGIWPDGYYMTVNQFPDSGDAFAGGAYVFERDKMLQGLGARAVFFDELPLVVGNIQPAWEMYAPAGQLPATLDGKKLPPAGAPGYVAEVDDMTVNNPYYPDAPPADHDEMRIWKFHVDWDNIGNSTYGIGSTAPVASGAFPGLYVASAGQPDFIVPIANYISSACTIEDSVNDCSPEKVNPPQAPQYIDVIGDRLMYRLTYRNFDDHESLLVSHTADTPVDPSTGVGRNGVRWYEIRDLSSSQPTVFQQSTFAPLDATNPLWRWMGSIAMDQSGDIAMGYSASGPKYFPSIHYAGRLATDPAGAMTQGEAVLFAGPGNEIEVGLYPYRNRWGDYSALTVDPTDDCTFWYTNEYIPANS